MTHTFFTFSAHGVLGKTSLNSESSHSQEKLPRHDEHETAAWGSLLLAVVRGATSPGHLALGSVPAAWAEDCSKVSHQFHTLGQQALSSQAGAQLDETIPTEGESSCGTEDVQSPHPTIFGSKDWSSGTCWPVFLQNSYNTLLFFRTSGLVLQCCGVFLEKKGWGEGRTLKLSRLTGQDLGRSSPVLLHWFRVDDSSYLEPWQPSRSMHNAVCFAS